MTKQEMFDKVWHYFITEKRQLKPTCRYRYEDGSSCAVGCLIPEDRQVPEKYNGEAIAVIAYSHPKVFKQLFDGIATVQDDAVFLQRIQDCHDLATKRSKTDPNALEKLASALRKIAQHHNLIVP